MDDPDLSMRCLHGYGETHPGFNEGGERFQIRARQVMELSTADGSVPGLYTFIIEPHHQHLLMIPERRMEPVLFQ